MSTTPNQGFTPPPSTTEILTYPIILPNYRKNPFHIKGTLTQQYFAPNGENKTGKTCTGQKEDKEVNLQTYVVLRE